jgi:diguanylate cyclase (GGDEF)-like protein
MNIRELQLENQQLKRTLNTAMSEAKLNKEVLTRFIDAEVKMLSCDKLSQLVSLLLNDFKDIFKLSIISMFLHDKDDLTEPLLTNLPTNTRKNLTLLRDPQNIADIYPNKKIRAGEIDRELRKKVFPDNPFILSCVLLPLINKGRLIGSLHLGARELNRYHSEYRYDYLERMASLLAVCIENCIIHENLAYLSSTDTLTKVYNRHSFDLEINKALQRANRQKQHLSLLFLDIDHFKHVNDKYGHPAGDEILKSFASILKQHIRNTDFLARFGGEEFAILLPDCEPKQAIQIANNLRIKVAEFMFDTLISGKIQITTSIGVSNFSFSDSFFATTNMASLSHTLLQNADDALYKAKQNGRNQVALKETSLLDNKAVSGLDIV